MAKVIFLGTAGTSAVVTKQLRGSGGIILQVEDLQFHINPGPGSIARAKEHGVNLHHNTAILVSNNQLQNCNDLNVVIDAMTHSGIEQRGVVLGSKSVLQNTEDTRPYITARHQNRVEKIIILEKKHKVGIELVEINSLSVDHEDEHAVGFKFYCPKFTFSYVGDTDVNDDLLDEISASDLLVLHVPHPGHVTKEKTLNTEDAIKIISHVRPRVAVITGFGLEMLKADPLQEAREIQRITGVQTIAAKDGLTLAPEGYGQYTSPVKGFY